MADGTLFHDIEYTIWVHQQKQQYVPNRQPLIVFKFVKQAFNPTSSKLIEFLESRKCYSYWMADQYATVLAVKRARKAKFESRIVQLAILCYVVTFIGIWIATIVASRPKTEIAFALINSGIVVVVKICYCLHTAAMRVRDGIKDNIEKLDGALQTLRTAKKISKSNLKNIQVIIDENKKREVDFNTEFWNSLATMSIVPTS